MTAECSTRVTILRARLTRLHAAAVCVDMWGYDGRTWLGLCRQGFAGSDIVTTIWEAADHHGYSVEVA